MNRRKINIIKTVLSIFISILFFGQSIAQNGIELKGLTFIQAFNNFEDLKNQYQDQFDESQTIVIEEDRVIFYGDNSENPVKTIEIIVPSFSREDINTFNQVNKSTIVSRQEYSYDIIGNSVLHVTLRNVFYNTKDDVNRSELISSVLYNCYGDIVAEFGRNIDQIVISPDHLRFIATRSGINPSDTLYIFNMNGDIITSFYSKDPAVSFTKDSRYVIVKEFGKNIISVFTADGDFILNTNTWADH